MADVTIISDQLASAWTIQNAAPDPTTGELDEYNAAIAAAAQVGIWYGDRIKMQSADIFADTETLRERQKAIDALAGITSATWPSTGLESAMAAGIDAARELQDETNYGDLSQFGAALFLLSWSGSYVGTPDPVTYNQQIFPNAYFAIADTGKPFPSGNFTDPADGLVFGRLYRATDGRVFIYQPWQPNPDRPNEVGFTTNSFEVTNLSLSQQAAPSDDVISRWQKALETTADKLTQVTQGKQAFLQELIASMSKYLNFATNVVQRYERNRLDIIGRF